MSTKKYTKPPPFTVLAEDAGAFGGIPENRHPKRVALGLLVSPDDLDVLRAIFGDMTAQPGEGQAFAKRMMKAAHAARRKLGFRWVT